MSPNPAEHKQTLNSNHTAEWSMQLFTNHGSKCPKVDFFFVLVGFGDFLFCLIQFYFHVLWCLDSFKSSCSKCVYKRIELKPLNCLPQAITSWLNWWTALRETCTPLTVPSPATALLAQAIFTQAQGQATYRPQKESKNKCLGPISNVTRRITSSFDKYLLKPTRSSCKFRFPLGSGRAWEILCVPHWEVRWKISSSKLTQQSSWRATIS